MEHISGETNMSSDGGRVDSHMHMRSGSSEGRRSGGGAGSFDDRFAYLRDRAAYFAGRARDGVGDRLGRAGTTIGGPGELLRSIRENPLASLSVAFSAGFLLAAASRPPKRHWILDRARLQLRTILVGAATATLTHELRSLLEDDDEPDDGLGAFDLDDDAYGGRREHDEDPFDDDLA